MANGDLGQAGPLLHIINISRLEPENVTTQNQAVAEITAMERSSRPELSVVSTENCFFTIHTTFYNDLYNTLFS